MRIGLIGLLVVGVTTARAAAQRPIPPQSPMGDYAMWGKPCAPVPPPVAVPPPDGVPPSGAVPPARPPALRLRRGAAASGSPASTCCGSFAAIPHIFRS